MTTFSDSKSDVLKPTQQFVSGLVNLPPYTTTERDALTTMISGSTVYNSTTNKINFYNGSGWEAVTSA